MTTTTSLSFSRLITTMARILLPIGIIIDLYLSLMSGHAVQTTFSAEVQSYDIFAHALFYFLLTLTALFCRPFTPIPESIRIFLLFAIMGGVLELFQPFVNRTCTVTDFAHNCIGGALAALLYSLFFLLYDRICSGGKLSPTIRSNHNLPVL
ncbi:MAG: VanZ family protein [Kiritimatiellia bacterium]